MIENINYKTIIHSFIDSIIINYNNVDIDVIEKNNKNVDIFIYADNENISRLIGKQGVIANALREIINIVGKKNNKFIHIYFEDKKNLKKDNNTDNKINNNS